MKILIRISFFALLITTIIACSKKTLQFNGKPISFDQVGYYKGSDKLRYFTFHINTEETIKRESIPDELLNLIKTHGSKQMNTAGRITASFYYIGKENTPDITMLSAQRANDLSHERRPLISVWIMPSEQVNVFKNPE